MLLKDYINTNYLAACKLQVEIVDDPKMINMVQQKSRDYDLVVKWMQDYKLLMGIESKDRRKIARKYFDFLESIDIQNEPECVDDAILLLLRKFHSAVPRVWLSAATKVLWCVYPNRVIIYDSFVERSLTVLQCIEPCLMEMPRIKSRPKIGKGELENDLKRIVNFYANCKQMVSSILKQHQEQLNRLRKKHKIEYPYDVRIIDKLLWMMGSPNLEFNDQSAEGK